MTEEHCREQILNMI